MKARSHDTFKHMVSDWCSINVLVLGQQKVDEKSNEITDIPALLELLIVKGCVITIHAMGCQQDIAAAIIEKEADYISSIKDNQEFLHDGIQEALLMRSLLPFTKRTIRAWTDRNQGNEWYHNAIRFHWSIENQLHF